MCSGQRNKLKKHHSRAKVVDVKTYNMIRSQSVDVKNFEKLHDMDIFNLTLSNTKCNSLTIVEEEKLSSK